MKRGVIVKRNGGERPGDKKNEQNVGTERYIARRSEQKELINAYLGGRGNKVCVEVCVTQTHAPFASQLTSHMNRGL